MANTFLAKAKMHAVIHNTVLETAGSLYLALVRVEVLWSLLLVERDAFQRSTVVPVASMVVTQDAENAVPFQCSMTANHQPSFMWAVSLL